MAGQHTENLFRRYRGAIVSINTVSGVVYEGRVAEITNDYLCLTEGADPESSPRFLFFHAIESMKVVETTAT